MDLPSSHSLCRTSFFLIGFYTLSLVCFVLIVKFGILPAINPPSNTLQGMFVLASAVAGIMGGAFTIFFWKATKYFIGAWGGFAFGLWIQCFKNGGLITPVGMRWILYIGNCFLYSPPCPLLTNLSLSMHCSCICPLHNTQVTLAYASGCDGLCWLVRIYARCGLLHHSWLERGSCHFL